jgi:hypothetical protein
LKLKRDLYWSVRARLEIIADQDDWHHLAVRLRQGVRLGSQQAEHKKPAGKA